MYNIYIDGYAHYICIIYNRDTYIIDIYYVYIILTTYM